MEKIPMMINGCCGGFRFSNLAVNTYNKRMKDIDPTYKPKTICEYENEYGYNFCSRFDSVMINIVHQLGKMASNKHSKIIIVYINKELKDYIKINEYDGMETFVYLFSDYKLDKIKEIISSQENSITQIEKIKLILDKKLE